MESAEIIGLVLLLALVLSIIAIAGRRWMLTRSGGIDLCWRTAVASGGRGWIFGQGRYESRGLVLYRSFSPSPFSSRILRRTRLGLGARREPESTEPDLLPVGAVIVQCTDGGQIIELALSESSLTGLRSWLESVPPGNRGLRGERRGGLREL